MSTIARVPVESSNIASIGYDADRQILAVEFKHGGLYHYLDVPESVHTDMMASPSVGKFLAAHIKPVFQFEKQPADDAGEV